MVRRDDSCDGSFVDSIVVMFVFMKETDIKISRTGYILLTVIVILNSLFSR